MSGTKKQYGFSLVEIVIALAIISVALVSVISMISVSLQSSKDSKDDTDIAVMTQTVVTLVRASGYTNVASALPIGGGKTLSYYFDSSGAPCHGISGSDIGILTTGSNGTVTTGTTGVSSATYLCTIMNKTPSSLPANFAWLRLDFSWPYSAPAANQQHKYVYTSLAQYY